MLRSHNRYPYSPIVERPTYDWPNGTRLAVYIALNIEVFPFGEGLGTDLSPRQPEPDIVNFTWRDYGNRVGVWGLIEALDEHKLPATILLNTEIYEHCPQIATAFRARGDEFVGHGRTNGERQSDLDETGERALIERSRDVIAKHEGRPPEGWLGPWLSETYVTPDLLEEAGFKYLMDWGADDQPFWLKTRSGKILGMPYVRPTSDVPMLHGSKVMPSTYADVLIDQFDEMFYQARLRPLVYNLSLHPFLVGYPFRLRHMRRLFAHLAAHRQVTWITTAGQIARHAMTLPLGTVPGY
jgi:peptidoglycan/xylan/chitin deacetylase (PgdA/CDA1 family)